MGGGNKTWLYGVLEDMDENTYSREPTGGLTRMEIENTEDADILVHKQNTVIMIINLQVVKVATTSHPGGTPSLDTEPMILKLFNNPKHE